MQKVQAWLGLFFRRPLMNSLRSRTLLLILAALFAIAAPAPTQEPEADKAKRSREEVKKAAAQGDIRAQHQLGLAYSAGDSAERNLPLAVKWLDKAAQQGNAESWLALGDIHSEGGPGVPQDLDAARKCYQKADEKGTPRIWHSLGTRYQYGRGGTAADWSRSAAFFSRAARRGHRESQNALGQFHQYGIGVPVDLARAIEWYTEAARQGDRWAEEKLGWLYEHGIGVARDRDRALAWYRKAEQHGAYCHTHLLRLEDPAALKRFPPDPEVPITRDIEITLRPDKDEYDLDDIIIIAIHYRNVGKETYSFTESHTGGFHVPFDVKDEKGQYVPNPYQEPPRIRFFSGVSSTQVLRPGKTLVIKKTLNQCVHFRAAGTYTVSTSHYVHQGEKADWGKPEARRVAQAKPLVLKVRHSDPTKKRQEDIARLVKAFRGNREFPPGMTPPAESFASGLDILRRLVFYNEAGLLPVFLDALELEQGSDFAETGLRALPDRAAVLQALEERLEQPARYRVFALLYPYFRLAGLDEFDLSGEPGRLDQWKREQEITRKVRDRALQLLRGDSRYRYGYLVPGLLGGSDDLFLIDYLSHCRPDVNLVRRCAWSIQRVKLGREHVPFLESLLAVERDWAITDAAIVQLVRMDRAHYLPRLKERKENFSPNVVRFLLEAQQQ
jgi:hypothetical protein